MLFGKFAELCMASMLPTENFKAPAIRNKPLNVVKKSFLEMVPFPVTSRQYQRSGRRTILAGVAVHPKLDEMIHCLVLASCSLQQIRLNM